MERLNNFLRSIPLMAFYVICSLPTLFSAQDVPAEKLKIMQWSAADMLPYGNGISILRYGAYGLGAYPHRINLPGSSSDVRIDGIPLPSLSSFGPDLELIPAAFVDSVDCDSNNNINVYTCTMNSETPETETNFLLGVKRRFSLQTVVKMPMNPSSSVVFGGTSSGIHSNEFTETNSYRGYFTKYQRTLEQGGTLFVTGFAFRDSDGLRNLNTQDSMGERETDIITLSTGIKSYRITSNTTISPMVYYRSGISRFNRNDIIKSLDDDSVGFSVISSTQRGNTGFDISLTSDSRFIDSRLHDDSWSYNDTQLSGTWRWTGDRFRYSAGGGIILSSEYGTGGQGESELSWQLTPATEFFVLGTIADKTPDAGYEIYPSLVFSDTILVSDLDMYRYMQLESGFTIKRRMMSYAVSAFSTTGKQPLFDPSSCLIGFTDNETYSGLKLYAGTNEKEKYRSDLTIYYITSSQSRNIWPVPYMEITSQNNLTKDFFDSRLHSIAFCNARVLGWNNGPTGPDGTSFYLDGGVAIKVLSLSLFYMVENITGENTGWFDALQWQGRNDMWGVKWTLEN